MLKMTRRIGRLSGLVAAGVAIVGTGSGVMAASYSAFSNTTQNAANSWNTGSVALGTDVGSAALITAPNQQLSATGSRCIKVTSTGSLATSVKLYSGAFTQTNALGSSIVLNIYTGSGGATDCTGFTASPAAAIYTGTLADFSAKTGFSTGVDTLWSPTGGTTPQSDTKVFKFTWSYAPSAAMGSSATETFTWEAQGS